MPRRRRRSLSPDSFQIDDEDDNEDFSKCPPPQRNAANARERARMRVLSKAFSRLKTTIPWVPADTKLSKLDTLRLASGYISHLKALLSDGPVEEPASGMPLNLTWPFNFQQNAQGSWSSECLSPERSNSPRMPQISHNPESHRHCVNNHQEGYYNTGNYYSRTENNYNHHYHHHPESEEYSTNGNSYAVAYND